MPFVNIRLIKELIADAPAEKKAEMTRRIADAISDVTGLPVAEVWIVYDEVSENNWFLGHMSVKEFRAKK